MNCLLTELLFQFVIAEYNRHVISNLRTYFARRCAMVGYEFLDADSIRESDIGIAVADATDSTKSEADIVLTEHALLSVYSAVQTSREICQIMKGCMVSHTRPFAIALFTDDFQVLYVANLCFNCRFMLFHQLSML